MVFGNIQITFVECFIVANIQETWKLAQGGLSLTWMPWSISEAICL